MIFIDMAPLVQQTYASQFPQSEPSRFYAGGSLNHLVGNITCYIMLFTLHLSSNSCTNV
jgi:hypothetical protein